MTTASRSSNGWIEQVRQERWTLDACVKAALAQKEACMVQSASSAQIFKTMTADNGPAFENLSQFESLGTKMYFTHPYSSWERAQNERHNGLLRDFIPKGMSMERFSDEDVLNMADTLNQCPGRVLGYHTPSELLMHSSMKFMLLSVFLDYSCSNSTCNLPTRVHGYIGSIYPLVC